MLTPPPPYRLRPMRLSDLDAVTAVDRVSFPTPAKMGLYRHELTANPLAHYQTLARMEETESESLIGYAGFWMLADEAHISTIAVHPDWRGRGLGELLLVNLLHEAQERAARVATLEVRVSNEVAQALYRKYRFEVVGERRRYYRDTGEDALIMTSAPLDARFFHMIEQRRQAVFARLVSEA